MINIEPSLNIKEIIPSSVCDWPGKVSTVIFMGGCNWRCPFCHNWEMAWEPDKIPNIPHEVMIRRIRLGSSWIDGIVISGGEPTCCDHLLTLADELKHTFNLPIKLDTNGSNYKVVKEGLEKGLFDHISMDIKGPPFRYKELTGGKCSFHEAILLIESHFELARKWRCYTFRTTLVPQLTRNNIKAVKNTVRFSGFEPVMQEYRPPSEKE